MKKLVVLGGTFLLLCGMSGCGGDSHNDLIEQMIEQVNGTRNELREIIRKGNVQKGDNLAKVAKNVRDQADKSAPELEKYGKKLQELTKRADALRTTMTREDKEQLTKKWKDKFQKALKDTTSAWNELKTLKVGDEEVGKEVVESLRTKGALDAFNLPK
jgi:hypothetical protein